MVVDEDGNIYMTGHFRGSIDIDPGDGVHELSAPASGAIFIAKVNKDGNLVWAGQFDGSKSKQPFGIDIDQSGNIYVTGDFTVDLDMDPGPGTRIISYSYPDGASFVCKLSNEGNYIWSKTFQRNTNSGVRFMAICADQDFGITLVGYLLNTLDVDPGPDVLQLKATGGRDNLIINLNVNGDLQWARHFGGNNDEEILAVNYDLDGNIVFSGKHFGVFDCDPGPGTHYLPFDKTGVNTFNDAFVAKFSGSGDFIWAKAITGPGIEYITSFDIDDGGNIYMSGSFNNSANFNLGTGKFTLTSNAPDRDHNSFILKLDKEGEFSWIRHIKGGNSTYGRLVLDKYDNVYVTARFNGNIDLDDGSGKHLLNDGDIYITKLKSSGDMIWSSEIKSNAFTEPSIGTDTNGNVYLTGDYRDKPDLDPGSGYTSFESLNQNQNSFIIKLGLPLLNLGHDTTICKGDTVILSSGYAASRFPHKWNSGESDSFLYVTKTVQVILTLDVDQRQVSDTIQINVVPKPVVYVGPDTAFCGLFEYRIDARGENLQQYKWNTGDTISYTIVEELGMYYVRVADENNCQNADTMEISSLPPPEIRFNPDNYLCKGGTLELNAGTSNLQYLWSTGATTPNITIRDTGWFSVIVSQPFCSSEDSIYVYEFCPPPAMLIPTAFTPNENGLNETFRPIIHDPVNEYVLEIYNRWGQLIFRSLEQNNGWDGSYLGQSCQEGVYFYAVSFKLDGAMKHLNGTLTLIR